MSLEPNRIAGRELIQMCAERIQKVKNNEAAIAQRENEVTKYRETNAQLNDEIDAMQAAIQAGQPYAIPPAK